MTLNLPPRVRQGIYLLTALGAPVAVYLQAKGYIGDLEFILWSGEVAVVSAMAGFNVSAPTETVSFDDPQAAMSWLGDPSDDE